MLDEVYHDNLVSKLSGNFFPFTSATAIIINDTTTDVGSRPASRFCSDVHQFDIQKFLRYVDYNIEVIFQSQVTSEDY